MATEEKKPETEAARAQPTPSSSATQSKVCPWGPQGTARAWRMRDARKWYFKCVSLFFLPTETVPAFTPDHIPGQCFYGPCWGCPPCHLVRGLCQPLVLIVRVSVGLRQRLLLSSPTLVPPFPVEVARRQQAGLPRGAGFRGGCGGRSLARVGAAEAGLVLLGLPAARCGGRCFREGSPCF